jgi:hypothetical protein
VDQELIDALDAINNNRLRSILDLSERLRDNKVVVLAALRKKPAEFRWASDKLRADFDVTLAAVTYIGWNLGEADQTLQDNINVVLAALNQNGMALAYASTRLRGEKDVVLAAVNHNGEALQYASEGLKDDDDVVGAAIDNTGAAFRNASIRQRKKPELALAAVRKDWSMIHFAVYKTDPELILAAIRAKTYYTLEAAMQYAGKCYIKGRGRISLYKDLKFMHKAVKIEAHALGYASENLRNNRVLVLAAVTQNGFTLQYASKDLRADPEVVKAALNNCPRASQFAYK